MIHIDSFNQIANAERAPGYKISRIYGKSLWDKIKRFLNKANNFAKRSKIVTKTLRTIGNPLMNRIADVTNSMGYGYGAGVTRIRDGMVIPPGSFYRTY